VVDNVAVGMVLDVKDEKVDFGLFDLTVCCGEPESDMGSGVV